MSDSENTQVGTGDLLPEACSRNAVLFIVNSHAATVNMRLYPPTSSMVTDTFEKAKEALDCVLEESDTLSVATVENNLMINDVRLSDVEQAKAPIRSFVTWMNEKGLSIIEFRKGMNSDELQTFFSVLSETTESQDRSRLAEDLKEQGVEHVTVNQRVYVAVTTSETGEIIGGVQGSSAPLDALKDELLMRYLMGKVDLGSVEDRELVEVLSDAGKVGGLLSRFLGEEGSEGGVLMKSQKAEEALNSLADMVSEIDDEDLREVMGEQITRVIAEMTPREMTSVLSGRAPENLNIRHVRENVITMLSDNQLLDMIDSLIDEYVEMKGESGQLETEWTRQRLKDLNELLSDVRGERGGEIGEAIDRKLDDAGIQEERDPHTGTRVLSAYQMLGGPLEEEDIELGEGVDQTVPRQVRQLYAMEETDLAAGMLLKIIENLRQDSPAVRRFASGILLETLAGLDDEHALLAMDAIRPMVAECVSREDDYEAFTLQFDVLSRSAELLMKAGRPEDSSETLELLAAAASEEGGRGAELVKYAARALEELMGPEGMIDIESLLLEEDDEKRKKTIRTLAALGPSALAPLVDMVKDRGRIELRDRALEAIRAAGDPGISVLLGELEKENPWYVHRNVLNVVADMRLAEGLPQVTAMVTNPDERIRREAVRSLARIGSRDSLEPVMTAANDQSPAVRRTAVRVLGMFGDSTVAQFLQDIINGQGLRGKEEDQGVVESACLALGDLRDRAFVPQLAELLGKGGFFKKGRPDEIRAAACIALGNVGDESALPVLEKAAKDPSVMVRGSAEKALRKLRDGLAASSALTIGEQGDVVERPADDTTEPAGVAKASRTPGEGAAEAPLDASGGPGVYEAGPAGAGPEEPDRGREATAQAEPLLPPPAMEQPPYLEGTGVEPGSSRQNGDQHVPEHAASGVPGEAYPASPPAAPAAGTEPPPVSTPPPVEAVKRGVEPPSPLEGSDPGVLKTGSGSAGRRQSDAEEESPDPSSLEYLIAEHNLSSPGDSGLEEAPSLMSGSDPDAKRGYDDSTLEGMILAEETTCGSTEPAGGPETEAPPAAPVGSSLEDDEGSGPAKLTLEPPAEVRDEPALASTTELASLWPEGSLKGQDYQVPPVPEAPEARPGPGDWPDLEGAGTEQQGPGPDQQIGGLPDDDYAPGRTDQPSTMERLLGPGESPGGPGLPPVAPPANEPPPPAPPPPPSEWK